jgi:hypothetical protein
MMGGSRLHPPVEANVVKQALRIAAFVIILGSGVLRVSAHHSLSAEFDLNKPLKLTGVVTKVEWGNPHALMYVDVPTVNRGKPMKWAFQLPSPNMFVRLGWDREPLRSGLTVQIYAFGAKDGANKGSIQDLVAADGRILFAAAPPERQ